MRKGMALSCRKHPRDLRWCHALHQLSMCVPALLRRDCCRGNRSFRIKILTVKPIKWFINANSWCRISSTFLAQNLFSKKSRMFMFSSEIKEAHCLMVHFKILKKKNISVRHIFLVCNFCKNEIITSEKTWKSRKRKKKTLYRYCMHKWMSCALNIHQQVHQSPRVLHLWPSPRWLFHNASGQPTGALFWSWNREGSRPARVWLAKSCFMGLGPAKTTWCCYTVGQLPLAGTGDSVRCNECHVADDGGDLGVPWPLPLQTVSSDEELWAPPFPK